MPLTPKGKKILKKMKSHYGTEKGKQVFYASINEGKITGAEGVSKKSKKGGSKPKSGSSTSRKNNNKSK